ncbi:MAG: hypothetical protein H0U56_09545 [Methylibium sp.]|nr:hypothetical protein [Methylibium sp.]
MRALDLLAPGEMTLDESAAAERLRHWSGSVLREFEFSLPEARHDDAGPRALAELWRAADKLAVLETDRRKWFERQAVIEADLAWGGLASVLRHYSWSSALIIELAALSGSPEA